MSQFKDIRLKIEGEVKTQLSQNSNILSATFVGSFVGSNDISSISDVDLVIVVKKLHKDTFNEILSKFEGLDLETVGLNGYHVRVNSTFGPLKFDETRCLVFHVMVYDLQGHIVHVNDSPFTCYDWERYSPLVGRSLRQLYPVGSLQIDDIVESRRGLKSYLSDIEKGVITYREYSFENDKPNIVKKPYKLDERHQVEYAFHILKFMMINFNKILSQTNEEKGYDRLSRFFLSLDTDFSEHLKFYSELHNWKRKGGNEPLDIINRTKSFMSFFFNWLDSNSRLLGEVDFLRHGKTSFNNGTFLGVGRNPSILNNPLSISDDVKYDAGYSSGLRRAQETVEAFNCTEIRKSPLLNEINYGKAEGLTLEQLNKFHPEMKEGWSRQEDPPFPNGESQADVLERLNRFIDKFIKDSVEQKILVVSHLVVLRMLFKKYWNMDMHLCYLLQIPHLEKLRFYKGEFGLIPNLSKEQRIFFRKQISQL